MSGQGRGLAPGDENIHHAWGDRIAAVKVPGGKNNGKMKEGGRKRKRDRRGFQQLSCLPRPSHPPSEIDKDRGKMAGKKERKKGGKKKLRWDGNSYDADREVHFNFRSLPDSKKTVYKEKGENT